MEVGNGPDRDVLQCRSTIAAGAVLYWGVMATQGHGFRLSTVGVILMVLGAVGLVVSMIVFAVSLGGLVALAAPTTAKRPTRKVARLRCTKRCTNHSPAGVGPKPDRVWFSRLTMHCGSMTRQIVLGCDPRRADEDFSGSGRWLARPLDVVGASGMP